MALSVSSEASFPREAGATSPKISSSWLAPLSRVLRIRGDIFEITEFARKHPGGSVITYFYNQDATDAFAAFHMRSAKAESYLRSLDRLSVYQYIDLVAVKRVAEGLTRWEDIEGLFKSEDISYIADKHGVNLAKDKTPAQIDKEGRNSSGSVVSPDGFKKREDFVLAEFRKFRQELIDEGYFKPNLFHVAFRIVEVIGFFILHYYLLYLAGCSQSSGAMRWVYLTSSIIIGGLAGGRSGWIQHEGGHHSLTGVISVDKAIQSFFISFGLICYNGKWNNMHNKHHAVPQKEDLDPDLDTLPFLATYEEILFRGRRRHLMKYFSWWLKYQHLSFFALTTVINVFFWHFYLHPREYLIRQFQPMPLLFILARYGVHITVAMSTPGMGMSSALLTLMATMFVSGVYLFGNFSLNHTFAPTVQKHINKNWVDQQMDHTVNITSSPLVNWWMGYLNCQIEHHLFPNMPQYRQPQICERTKAFCKKCDIPYVSMGYFRAMYHVLNNLRNISFKVDDYEQYYSKESYKTQKLNTITSVTPVVAAPQNLKFEDDGEAFLVSSMMNETRRGSKAELRERPAAQRTAPAMSGA